MHSTFIRSITLEFRIKNRIDILRVTITCVRKLNNLFMGKIGSKIKDLQTQIQPTNK